MRANTPIRISGGYAPVRSVQRLGTGDRMFTPYSVQKDSAIQTRFSFQPISNPLTLSLLVVMPSSSLGVMDTRPASTLLKHSGKSVPGVSQGRLGEETLDVRPLTGTHASATKHHEIFDLQRVKKKITKGRFDDETPKLGANRFTQSQTDMEGVPKAA